jgi:hypothetical protein
MGKLHTLRRAIRREPDKWLKSYSGASYFAGAWRPSWYARSYRKFIQKVLREIRESPVGQSDDRAGG